MLDCRQAGLGHAGPGGRIARGTAINGELLAAGPRRLAGD
jgi:hypothetical protein